MPKKKNKSKEQSSTIGRPPMFRSPEELEAKIDEYFKTGRNVKKVVFKSPAGPIEILMPMPTINGLVLFLGFCDRHSFYDLEKRPEFSHTIKKARSRIAQDYEEDLKNGLGAGAIFALKNINGWVDKQEIEHTGDLVLGYGHRKPVKH